MPSGRRLLLRAIVVTLVLTAGTAIGVLLFGDFGDTEARILGTTSLLSLAGLVSLPAATLLEQGRLAPLAWTAMALAAAGFAASMVSLWGDNETALRVTGTLGSAAAVATQTSGLAVWGRADDPVSVRRLFALATGLVTVVAGMVVAAIWFEAESDPYWRAMAALAVANVLAVVLQPVLRRGRAATTQRLRLVLADGSASEVDERGAFADAAARAIRRAERKGVRVRSVERL